MSKEREAINVHVSELQKHITHFSEEIKLNPVHQEEVIVGGKITNVIPPIFEEYSIIILDDCVGILNVFVPEGLIETYSSYFEVGKYIFLKGFVNVLSYQRKDQSKKDVSIYAYDIKQIEETLV